MGLISGHVEGLDILLTGLDDDVLAVREAAFQGVLLALGAAFRACETMLSPSDHTLRELALMGHPYSRAHGQTIHTPDELVHLQSGAYRAALEKVSPQGAFGEIIGGSVQIGDRMADRDRWIQEGTTMMRARPWMQWIIDNYGDDLADVIIARIDQALRDNPATANTITGTPAA
jgi:hypothetical protein